MNAASISEVLSAWEAAARSVGRNLPVGIVERGLAFLPDSPEWAISEDASALFALTKDDVVFTFGLGADSETSLHSRPLYADRLLVRLSWSQPEPTEAGGLTWSTTWMFYYRDERGHNEWQRLSGSVDRDANGTERVDARERFARAIAKRAGWAPAV
jgi:hypothetical protein